MILCKTSFFKAYICALVVTVLMVRTALAEDVETTASENVFEAIFTSAIKDRQPVDHVLVLTNDIQKIYFYTDIRNLGGTTITHIWEYEGNLVSEKTFDVGGPRWRVYSQKILNPELTGIWSVTVINGNGWPIHTEQFQYINASESKAKKAILPWSEQ
jgi:hypothetical protein